MFSSTATICLVRKNCPLKIPLIVHAIVVALPITEPLTVPVLIVAQSFIFLHSNAESGDMSVLEKVFKNCKRTKTCFFTSLHITQPFRFHLQLYMS